MHVRFSTLRGTSVRDDETGEVLGTLANILLNPDTGKVEGFFVHVPGFLYSGEFLLVARDVRRLGKDVRVLSVEVLVPLADHVRLAALVAEGRPVLGQQIRTESGLMLGRCVDVQFKTELMQAEWIFPRKFFRTGAPIPISDIVEVRPEAIIVREPFVPLIEKSLEMTGA